jgi:hypothetical protein
MRAEGLVRRLSAIGPAAQASVPGVYAWGVTVAPAVWSRADFLAMLHGGDPQRGLFQALLGGPTVAKLAALLAVSALAGGVVGERRWGGRARFFSLWGFVLASALAWSAVPASLGPLRIDAPQGIAGMLGWALFALASAAPALEGRRAEARVVDERPLVPRKTFTRGDAGYVAGGAIIAAVLQIIGWRVASAERALLVRFVALAAGLAVIGAATDVALARHVPRVRRSRRRRLRGAMALLVAIAILALAGLLFALRE